MKKGNGFTHSRRTTSRKIPSEEARNSLLEMARNRNALQGRLSDSILTPEHVDAATEYLVTNPQVSYSQMIVETNLAAAGNCAMTLVVFHRLSSESFPFEVDEENPIPTTIEDWRKILPRGVLQRVTKVLCHCRATQATGLARCKKDKAYTDRMVKLLSPFQERILSGTLETFEKTYSITTDYVNLLNSCFSKYCATHEALIGIKEKNQLKPVHDSTCEVCGHIMTLFKDVGIRPTETISFVTNLVTTRALVESDRIKSPVDELQFEEDVREEEGVRTPDLDPLLNYGDPDSEVRSDQAMESE